MGFVAASATGSCAVAGVVRHGNHDVCCAPGSNCSSSLSSGERSCSSTSSGAAEALRQVNHEDFCSPSRASAASPPRNGPEQLRILPTPIIVEQLRLLGLSWDGGVF